MAYHPFRHLGLKATSVGLATLLWFTLARDQIVERSLQVPLEFQNIPENMEIVGDPPGVVDVRVRGTSSRLGRLGPGDVVAVLDVRGARPGERLFHLLTDQVRVPYGVEVAQVSPPTIPLAFEPTGRKVVPVRASVEGTPAPGFRVASLKADPAVVEVIGPESRLKELDAATTEAVSVDGVSKNVVDEVTIGVEDSALRLRKPQSAKVTVEVVPVEVERMIPGVEVAVRAPPRRSAAASPARVDVLLKGAARVLERIERSQVRAWVDCTGLRPGRHRIEVRVDAPESVEVIGTRPGVVQVRVR